MRSDGVEAAVPQPVAATPAAAPVPRRSAPSRVVVGPAHDPAERDADLVADRVMRAIQHPDGAPGPHTTASRIQRSSVRIGRRSVPGSPPGPDGPDGQVIGAEGGPLGDDLTMRIRRANRQGNALDGEVRRTMEPAFGADFGRVRVHTNSRVTSDISAAAFTIGRDVHFAPGAYRPSEPDGQRLIAHELAHVVQQGGVGGAGRARQAGVQRSVSTVRRSWSGSSIVRRSPSRPVAHRTTHRIAAPTAQVDEARRGRGTPVPASARRNLEAASGSDLSDVRVHDHPAAWSLNGDLGTAALTSGRDVFMRKGFFRPDTETGRRLIDHELGHVTEQRRSGADGVQALALDDSRVTAAAQRRYMQEADILEQRLGPHLSRKPAVTAIADDMLARLRRIVDAWAEATKTGTSKVYESEFSFPTGTKYYGSFQLTAKEIKRVFEDQGQPLRKKLNLVYYCVRNGNLNKYLEVAAAELMATRATGKAATQRVVVPDKSGKQTETVSVKPGFAAKSGLKSTWDTNTPMPVGKTSKDEVEPAVAKKQQNATKDKPAVLGSGMFSGAFGGGSATGNQLRGDKVYDTYAGLGLEDTRTLTRGDVDDITTAEMRLLYERSGQRQPLWLSHDDKTKFKAQANTKILWEQGGENIEVKSDSETRRIAEQTLSRLEGGISGSTDLMMHASKHLGYTAVADLKKIRLALVAWMLSNRDHSFFEIMKVADDYGAPFHLDPAHIGSEYEDPDNFHPLSTPEVQAFKDLLPGKKMPAYYLSGAYTGQVDQNLPNKGTTSDAAVNDLRTKGMILDDSWKADARADDLAQWLSLIAIIPPLNLATGRTEAELRANRLAVQRLMRDRSWQYVVRAAVDPNARANLRAVLAHQFGAGAVVSDGDLNAIGLPPSLFTPLEEYKRYDVLRLHAAVQAVAPTIASSASKDHVDATSRVKDSLAYTAVSKWIGDAQAAMVVGSMFNTVLPGARASRAEKSAAATLPKYAAFVQAYPTPDARRARLVTLGIPPSLLTKIGNTFKDPSFIHHYLDELGTLVAGAAFRPAEPPSSPANQAARATISNSPQMAKLTASLGKAGPQYGPLMMSYLVEKSLGAKGVSAAESAANFAGLATAEQVDQLTALGVPRDVAEGSPGDSLRLLHDLRRVVIEATFDPARSSRRTVNKQAWQAVTNSGPYKALEALRPFKKLVEPIAASMVRQIHTANVVAPAQLTLARAVDQRMANVDKVRLGKSHVIDTTTLATPSLQGEAATNDPVTLAAREERYWATTSADNDFAANIAGKSPTVRAKLVAYKQTLTNDDVERDTVMTEIATDAVAQSTEDQPPTVAEMKATLFGGMSKKEIAETILSGYLPTAKILTKIDPQTKQAIDAIAALSPRERGALYQYTNKLHDELGYATQSFSMSNDFGPTDVSNVTDKLRALPFMLPMIEALHSALERLPAYTATPVYSGRKSGFSGGLTTATDDQRLQYAHKAFKVGSVVSYSYPLSTAKDLDSSFIVMPGYDVCLLIQQPILTGRDIEYLSNKPNEKEVLFPQGCRFKVVRFEAQPPALAYKESTKNKLWVVLQEV